MKKIFFAFVLLLMGGNLFAQKYGYVDTQYILDNIPAFKTAQEQIDQTSKQYQKELETVQTELQQMYKNFQSESVLLSADMKQKREDVIINREKEYKNLQRKYFGPEGDLYKKRQNLVKPIQNEVYNAIKVIADEGGYAVIFDKANGTTLLYTNPTYDLSDQVLKKLGYKN